ncbi:siderophore-interacting protein [Streptomyces sp. NPDC060205]|uniref:siderophore-interacting protein n=1 Tax=Streptomyces sp. NPDC060205 TaxID=3347072 RepID=UPI003660E0B6
MKDGGLSASSLSLPVVSRSAPRRHWSHDHDDAQVPSPGQVAVASRIQRSHKRRRLSLTVQGSEQPSRHFMTVTLGGEDVRHLQRSGFDQAGRLFFADPDDDATEVFLPSSERWLLQLTQQGGKHRPRVRTYSIRRLRPERSRSGHPMGARRRARHRVAFLDEEHSYLVPGVEVPCGRRRGHVREPTRCPPMPSARPVSRPPGPPSAPSRDRPPAPPERLTPRRHHVGPYTDSGGVPVRPRRRRQPAGSRRSPWRRGH